MQTHQHNDNNKRASGKKQIFTKELIGSILIVLSVATLFILFTGNTVFGTVGAFMQHFVYGATGSVLTIGLLLFMATSGVLLILGKVFQFKLKTTLLSIALFALIIAFAHALTLQATHISSTLSYGEFIKQTYLAGKNTFVQITAGGALFSILVYPFTRLLSYVGTYIFLAIAIVVVGYFIFHAKIKSLFTLFGGNKSTDKVKVAKKQPKPKAEKPTISVVQPTMQQDLQQPTSIVQPMQMPQENTQPVENNENVLPNIIGKEYANYGGVSSSGKSTYSSSTAESSNKKPSFMNNGIFDSDSYFNKRHLQNADTTPSTPSYQTTTQSSSGWYPYGEPPVRNIFENNTRSTINNTPVEEPAMRYSTLFAKETEQPRQSAIPKPIVTNTPRMQESKPQTTVGSVPTRTFEWGAGRDSIRESVSIEPPIATTTTNVVERTIPTQVEPESPQTTRRMSSFIDEIITPRVPNTLQTAQQEEATLDRSEQISTRQIPNSRVPKMPEQEPAVEEISRSRNIFDTPKEPVSPLPEKECTSSQEQEPLLENTAEIWTDDSSLAARGRDIFENIIEENTEDILANAKESEEFVLEDSLEDGNDVVEDINLFDTEVENLEDCIDDNEEDFAIDKSDENIFDTPFELPEEVSNAEIALQTVVQQSQEEELPTVVGQEELVASQEIDSSQYTKKDYLTISPNFIKEEKPEPPKPKKRIHRKYNHPPIDLFEDIEGEITVSEEEKEKNSNIIIATLKGFNISAEIVSITCGPAVTRYDIDIPGNIPTSKVFQYRNELAMRLQSSAGVNIQNNYSNGSISIEVPNRERATIGLKEILNDKNYKESCKKTGSLVFSLGKDIEGKVVYGDIAKMKHLLVAGATGTGKSVFLNSLIISLLAKYSPEDLRIILIDPKQVEFSIYSKLPHLMVDEIICDASKVINVLNWSIAEMERRYGLFKEKGKTVHVRDIDEYNAHLTEEEEKLPKIVLIIDEVADLMQQAKKDIEDRIQSLTQKSRAAGIHLVLATQRPSVNVITGVIKANLPSRVAFKVAQDVDSRTILDCQGAETLLGKGDMLYKLEDMTMPARVQASYLSSEEVQKVVEYIKGNNDSFFDESIIEFLKSNNQCESDVGEDGDNIQPVYIEALDIAITSGQVSISMIQRKLSVGYNKAGRIIEWMEHMGYISAFDGAKARRILITREEFEAKYGDYTS